jgi:predicted DNA-binding transcriptional regulator AlpA
MGRATDGAQNARAGNSVAPERPIFENLTKPYALLTAQAVAQFLGVSPKTVYLWAKIKRLDCVVLGRAIRFRPEVIQAIITGQRDL